MVQSPPDKLPNNKHKQIFIDHLSFLCMFPFKRGLLNALFIAVLSLYLKIFLLPEVICLDPDCCLES